MLRPAYKISLGTIAVTSRQMGPFDSVEVLRAKGGAADEAVIRFGTKPSLDAQAGDTAAVELGWDGDTQLVFTGAVDKVDRSISAAEFVCAGAQMKLLRQRASQVFVNQKAGEVVGALAGVAGVDTDIIEDGIDLPFYFADSAHLIYDHCLGLSRHCGFDLYTTVEGKLMFAAFSTTAPAHKFSYGAHILSASVETSEPLDAVTAVPESPASSAGDDTASWFVKDSSAHQSQAGGGAATLVFSDPVLRTRDAAETAAKAKLYFSRRDATSGTVELMGAPEVDLGDAVQLDGVPAAGIDGVYQVMALRHRLDARRGFRTVLTLGGMP